MNREQAEQMLGTAESAYRRAQEALSAAQTELSKAETAHDETRSARTRQAVTSARVDLESAERVWSRCSDALEAARVALARIDRTDREAAYQAGKAKMAKGQDDIDKKIAAIIAIDRQLDAAVLALARVVDGSIRRYGELEEQAVTLRMDDDLTRAVAKPSLATARLAVQRAAHEARLAEGREDLSVFLQTPETDWRRAEFSADDRAVIDAQQAKYRRYQDHADGVAQGKGSA